MSTYDDASLPLRAELVICYRQTAIAHSPDPQTLPLLVFDVRRCADPRFPMAQLISAGQSIEGL
jgi:hypothetical protein